MAKCQAGCRCKRHASRTFSVETRAKISAAKMGHEVSPEARVKIGNASRGRTASPETVERMRASHTQHGHGGRSTRTPEYRAWSAMIQRCHSPGNSRYASYGGAGITVAQRWRESFVAFLEDMGEKPEPKTAYSLDRIDGAKGYEPGNCRWATASQQQRNRPNFDPVKRGQRRH